MRQLPQSVRLLDLVLKQELIARIDYETDAIIQQSLRHELMNDVTVITVAHRLQTIMDADKIVRRLSYIYLIWLMLSVRIDGVRCWRNCGI